MNFRPWLALTLSLGLIAGCAQQPTAPQLGVGTEWKAESIDGNAMIDRSHVSFTLHEEGRAVGSAGCNRWFAPYTLEGDKISFGPVGSTMMACSEALMEQEQRFLKALHSVKQWQLRSSGELVLTGDNSIVLRSQP
ncbi:META domain-containing protein [Atopomonas sediminilitoris]|uniref:META domain-containing protein n=1 Tax=Atopomonas sediminilitoris TaxID=2919919 RepID=UPI001F4DB3CB|nr:META domain-containing protein [Atopomonas sediminilitoris]MCJ8167985.1 META domain-containing protein [Atopomonas sediminilitoris]